MENACRKGRVWVVYFFSGKYEAVAVDKKTKAEIIDLLPRPTPNFTFQIAESKPEAINQIKDFHLENLVLDVFSRVKSMTIGPPFDGLPGYGTQFGDEELKLAIAIARVLETLNLAKADTSQTTLSAVLSALGSITTPSDAQLISFPDDLIDGGRLKVSTDSSSGGIQQVEATDFDIRNLSSSTDSVNAVFADTLLENDRIKTSKQKSEQGVHYVPNLSSSPVLVISSNASRQGISIYNDLFVSVFVGYVSDISVSKYAIKVEPRRYFEMPFDYVGDIYSFLESGTGVVQFVEFI